MNATLTHVEVKNEDRTADAEMVAALEAVKELSSIELAYVGGGTAAVSFI